MVHPAIFTSLSSSVSPDPILVALHATRHKFFVRLIVATVLVMVGVILEGAEELPIPCPRLDTTYGTYTPRYRWIAWRRRIAKTGWLLIVLGVIGEGWYEIRVSNADRNLETYNNERLLAANKEAGDAKDSANAARGSAKTALTVALRVRGIADEAQVKVEGVAKRAEQLRKAVEEIGPRSLSLDQQRAIVKALRPFSGHPQVVVVSYGLDGEGAALATQLMQVIYLGTGTMPEDRRAGPVVAGGFETGVSIRGPESENAFMFALQQALTSAGNLKQVSVNGLQRASGTVMATGTFMAAGSVMAGGKGPLTRPPIPTSGPVVIMVGIKPLPLLLLHAGK